MAAAKRPSDRDLIDGFLSRHRGHTRASYASHINQWVIWLAKRDVQSILDASAPMFDTLLSDMRAAGLSGGTIGLRQVALHRLYDYLVEQKVLRGDPVPDYWRSTEAETASGEPNVDAEQLAAMLGAAADDFQRAVIRLAGIEGFKNNQVLNLTVQDLVKRGGYWYLSVLQLGQKSAARISDETGEVLTRLIGDRKSGPLLLNYEGNPCVDQGLQRATRKAGQAAGIPFSVSPRILNRSRAAHLGESGGTVELISRLVGSRPARLKNLMPRYGVGSEGEVLHIQAVAQNDAALQLLDEAETLLTHKSVNVIAPIVLAGAALEMILRSMCSAAQLEVDGKKPGINAYASKLRQARLIDPLTKKQVEPWAELRNTAAHGVDAAISRDQAQLMVKGVALFATEYQHAPEGEA